MKRLILSFVATFALCLCATAQTTRMRINFADGKQMSIPVGSVDYIDWVTDGENPDRPDVTPAGVEAVDLGLSVKWANMNVGAESVTDYGDYFAWGETEGYKSGKNNFSGSTYKYYMITTEKYTDKDGFEVTENKEGLTKYVADGYRGYDGFRDDKETLDIEDDAANANWGGEWRMPTSKEIGELINKCSWQWGTLNNVWGYKVIGPNDNFIFLPAAGYRSNSGLSDAGSGGDYWSSSLVSNNSYGAYYLEFYSRGVFRGSLNRAYGRSVRPVCP